MTLNTNKLLLVVLMALITAPLTQAQLKTFKPGDVIKSSEIIENFAYLEDQISSAGDPASAQCSAKQYCSDVVISCTVGSSAILLGSGSILTYPEGQVADNPKHNADTESPFLLRLAAHCGRNMYRRNKCAQSGIS